jgi:DNA-binding transcriptional LysR family regulator
VVECGSIFATLQLLQTSEAVAMLPESVVRDYLKAGLLRELPLAVGQKLTGFGVLTRREDVLSEPAQAFCALLRKYATHGAHA